MKPEKETLEWTVCPTCNRKYGFINCRVSKYNSDGERYEICLSCGVKEEKQKDPPK